MMQRRQLASVDAALGFLAARGARALVADSRRVRAGDAFIAWPGHAVDARRFVADALAAGAAACLIEAEGAEAFGFEAVADAAAGDAAVGSLTGLKAAAGEVAAGFMGRPSDSLSMLAVTGTNGKTSTAWWLAQALGALGRRCGVVGTLGVGEPPRGTADGTDATLPAAVVSTGLTTPDPVTLQASLRRFVDAGFEACAIEASSIGLAEHRLAGTAIEVALLTNFTQDHLDYHRSMDDYWQAKARLFDWPGLRAAVVNIDDPRGRELAQALQASVCECWTYSAAGSSAARLVAFDVRRSDDGLGFEVREQGGGKAAVATRLIGDFNVANLLAVIGGLRSLGVTLADAAAACAALLPVPGRMQRVAGPGAAAAPQVVVDYAHTPDALEQALRALAPWAQARGGRLWCVFGCGGNRDASKRPLMGAAAARLADRVVVTSDNPRDESPEAIVAAVMAGTAGGASAEAIVDRAQAIGHALHRAGPHDVVLIAGKGHEDHQEIAGMKRPFSDAALAGSLLHDAARAGRAATERCA